MIGLKLHKYGGEMISIVPGVPLSLEENSCYELVFEDGTESCEVYFGDVAIAPDPTGKQSIRPGHWAGNSELRIEGATSNLVIPVRVTPREEKLSDALWVSMLQDLETWLASVTTGIEGGREGTVGTEGVFAPFVVEALSPLISVLENAIRVLLESPRQLDVSRLEDVPLRMMRRVDRETLWWLSRHPEVQDYLDPWKSLELNDQHLTLPQRGTIDVLDHPANRYISWLVHRVVAVLEDTATGLENSSKANQTDDNIFWCRSRAESLREGAKVLHRIWKYSFLSEVPREPASEAALQVVLDDPFYLRVHKIGRLFLNPLFRFDHDAAKFQAAVRPSYTIYELWCFFAVGEQLKQLLPQWHWQTSGLNKLLGTGGTGAGALHRATNRNGECLMVLFNTTFSGYFSRAGRKRWSISGQRRPDIVVSYKPQEGDGKWVALDAKYRVGVNNLSDAFSSVHIYRDSLRYEGCGGPCHASVLISPSSCPGTEEWFSAEYLETYQEGIWELKPGTDNLKLGEWLVKSFVKQ